MKSSITFAVLNNKKHTIEEPGDNKKSKQRADDADGQELDALASVSEEVESANTSVSSSIVDRQLSPANGKTNDDKKDEEAKLPLDSDSEIGDGEGANEKKQRQRADDAFDERLKTINLG